MIDKTAVTKIARLAHIEVTETEKEQLAAKLSGIMTWIDLLNEVDTENVPPLSSVSESTLPWRKDEITDGHRRDEIIANAPASEYGCFVVPKVINDE